MPAFHPLRILFLLIALCTIVAHSAPLAQQDPDLVEVTTFTGSPEPTSTAKQQPGPEFVGFVFGNTRRDTVGILMSCSLTLFLCVCE